MGPGEIGGKTAVRSAARPARARRDPAVTRRRSRPRSPADPDTAQSVAIGQLDVTLPGIGGRPVRRLPGRQRAGSATRSSRDAGSPGPARPSHRPTSSRGRASTSATQTTITCRRTLDHGHARRRDLRHAARERRQPRPARDLGGPRDARSRRSSRRRWEAQPVAGVDVQDYRSSLQDAIGPGAAVFVEGDSSGDASFLLFLSVVGAAGRRARRDVDRRRVQHGPARDAPADPRGGGAQGDRPDAGPGRRDGHRDGRARSVSSPGVIGVPIGLARPAPRARLHGRGRGEDAHPGSRCTTCSRSWCSSVSACSASAIGALGAYLPAQRAARASIAPVLQAE